MPITALLLVLGAAPQESHDHEGHVHDGAHEQGLGLFGGTDHPLALGLVFDAVLDHLDGDGPGGDFDAEVRTLGLTFDGRIDGQWRVNATVVFDEDEVELEEAFATYGGLGDSTQLYAGRFFVDFGRQMTRHIHDIPTPERPGVLAEYLGEELPGTGLEFAHRAAVGERSSVRLSFAALTDLETHEHGEEDGGGEPEVDFAERVDADELAFVGRATHRMNVGEHGSFEWGLSARHLSDFAVADEGSGLRAEGLSNTVYGLEASLELPDEGESGWAFGGEYLVQDGDLGAEVNGASLDVLDSDVSGFYLWGERRLDERNAVGALVGRFEHPEADAPEENELTLYYSRRLADSARIRFAASQRDSDEEGDSTRLLVQLTLFAGPHSHGGR